MPPASPATTLVFAQRVEQRSLAVVDMAHDGDDGRARLPDSRIDRPYADEAFLDIGFGDALHRVAEFVSDELGHIGIDQIVDLVHLALFHQELDHIDGAFGHAVGKFLNGDGFR